jgi:hypothetical protein
MRYLAWALIFSGLVCILCELESCRRFYYASPSPDTGQPYLDGDADATLFIEGEGFIYMIGSGIVATCLGLYMRRWARSDSAAARLAERLTITRPIFCPQCGRPLRINESTKAKLLGFIPRLICAECKVGTEFSGAAIFCAGFVLAFCGFLFLEKIPLLFTSIFGGLMTCLIGVVRWERQFSKAKRFISRQTAEPK